MRTKNIISRLLVLIILQLSALANAVSIGSPPVKTINIPISENAQYFDMEQDNDKSIYVGHTTGVKIFDGSLWHDVETGANSIVRRLYFDGNNRVYFGGTGILGYVYKNKFGSYQYKNITPKEYFKNFNETWHVFECNGSIVFSGLYNIFIYDKNTDSINSWDFKDKLGAGFCYQNRLIYQDRVNGLVELVNGNWQKSAIHLEDNRPISKFQKLNDDTYLVISKSDDWRIINKNRVSHLPIQKELPSLNQYFATESLEDGNIILGSSNGLLHFVDINKKQFHSFQLTNEWVSKILNFDDGLLILAEFEIYYIQWPSAIRIQGKDSGLASNIYDTIFWNNHHYIASSAGVFIEDQQLNNEKRAFRRLDWTNGEAWGFLPINSDKILLSESHKIFMIDQSNDETIKQPLSDVIYPRELIQSQFNPDHIFVITEIDVQLLIRNGEDWLLKPLFDKRAVSIVENKPGSVLLTDYNGDLYHITLDQKQDNLIKIEEINENYQVNTINNEIIALIFSKQKSLIAYNSHEIYELNEGKPPIKIFKELHPLIEEQSISGFFQEDNGLFYGFTPFKVFYQDALNKWNVVDVSHYIKGYINNIKINGNEIKILTNGKIISYSTVQTQKEDLSQYSLRMTQITVKQNNNEKLLSLNPEELFEFEYGDVTLNFSFVFNDLKNHESNLYRYKLNGEITDWSDFTKNSKIQISDLNAGEYKLNIQAIDSNGKLYDMPSYQFIVHPPWYLTGLAKLCWAFLILATIGLFVYLIIKRRESIHETQKQELKNIIDKKTKELQKANTNLQKIAHLDGLTGLSNRYFLDEYIKRVTLEDRENIIAIMMDMDDFKKYNDSNGHIAGDELLKKLASYLLQTFNRSSDIVARYGGEEFLIILLDCEMALAISEAEKVRKHLDDEENKTSLSIGLSHSSNQSDLKSLDAIYNLIDKADQALYDAKNSGKNKLVISK